MDFNGKKVLVVGMARSGMASAKLLKSAGAYVIANDTRPASEFGDSLKPVEHCVDEFLLGVDSGIAANKADVIVLSPSVPMTLPWAKEAKARGIPVIGEIELAYMFCKAPVVAITGTNGKTTTTALTGDIFENSGRRSHVLGNIGIPFADKALDIESGDIVIAEVAGFQLESAVSFKPVAAAMLNITPDHLDRFGDMETYTRAKAKIYENMTAGEYIVLNAGDKILKSISHEPRAKVLWFNPDGKCEGAYCENGKVYFSMGGSTEYIVDANKIRIPGRHNLENALAATALSRVMGVSPDVIGRTLMEFPGVPHRIEFVAEINGVRYINDSKGTNPEAAIKAIEAISSPLVLIAGGYDKHADFTGFINAFGDKVKELILFGETAGQIKETAYGAGFKNIHMVKGLNEAVDAAKKAAQSGWTILLSPACASWDMFEDFEQRGKLFKEYVLERKGKK